MFRAFQGLSGAGAYALSTVVLYELVPKNRLPIFGGIVFAFVGVAAVSGPVIGGIIDLDSTWRWIFLWK